VCSVKQEVAACSKVQRRGVPTVQAQCLPKEEEHGFLVACLGKRWKGWWVGGMGVGGGGQAGGACKVNPAHAAVARDGAGVRVRVCRSSIMARQRVGEVRGAARQAVHGAW